MAFPWSGKRESGEMGHPLEKAAELLGQANEQIAAFLVRSQSEGLGPECEAFRSLEARLSALAEKLDRWESRPDNLPQTQGSPAAAAPSAAASQDVRELVERHSAALAAAIAQLQEQVQGEFQEMARLVCPLNDKLHELAERLGSSQAAEETEPTTVSSAEWERAILGPDLAAAPALAVQRLQLIDGILGGDPGACSLAGQLLVFQSAAAERLPQLLKDIGEAYYRWQRKTRPGTSPMEGALVQWLQRRCEAAGIANTIEIVHPGERFDASRHHATSRGVEITEVHGWIVLRDNGKVYMKATVSVR